jgi:hypothetical protein
MMFFLMSFNLIRIYSFWNHPFKPISNQTTMVLLYVDPGSGFLLAQVITSVAGAVLVFRNHILTFIRHIFRKNGSS